MARVDQEDDDPFTPLNWTLDRTSNAADALDKTLRTVGFTVYRRSGRIAIRAASDNHRDALARLRNYPTASMRISVLSPQRARLVHQALKHPFPNDGLRDSERKDIAILLRAGILELRPDRTYTPTNAVKERLLLLLDA